MTNAHAPAETGILGKLDRGLNDARVALGAIGIFLTVFGLVILIWPLWAGAVALEFLAFIIAGGILSLGLFNLSDGIFNRFIPGKKRAVKLLVAVLYIAAGFVLFWNLAVSALALAVVIAWTIGVVWIADGVTTLFSIGSSENKALSIVYAVAAIVAGIFLIVSPLISTEILWLVVGISFLVLGVIQIVRAAKLTPEGLKETAENKIGAVVTEARATAARKNAEAFAAEQAVADQIQADEEAAAAAAALAAAEAEQLAAQERKAE